MIPQINSEKFGTAFRTRELDGLGMLDARDRWQMCTKF